MFEGAMNNNRNILSLEAKTSDELAMMISRLSLPTKIVSIVFDSKKEMYVAFVVTSRKMIKKQKEIKE